MSLAAPLRDRSRIRELDWLMFAVAGLCCLGLVMAVSIQGVREDSVMRALQSQGSKLIAGIVLFLVFSMLPIESLRRWSIPIFGVALLAVWVAAIAGTERNHARRWLSVGGMTVQPVDFARIALIVVTAALIGGAGERMRELRRGLLVVMAPAVLLAGGLFLQPDNGNALLCVAIAGVMAVAAGVSLLWIGLGLVAAVPLAVLVVGRHGYVVERFMRWLNEDPPYQVAQGLIAIESGGLAGAGIGHGWRKMGFVPEPHNDFVFTIIGEELGFLGGMIVLASFFMVGVVSYRLARRLTDPFHRYLVFGSGFALCAQAVINLLVTTGLAPAKGIDLPFVSAGGTNLMTSLGLVGLIGNAARTGQSSGQWADSNFGGT
ncbi:MAG: FtsW/RodA/SpoVE family cell cycle protein [Planctomycetota bacterium]